MSERLENLDVVTEVPSMEDVNKMLELVFDNCDNEIERKKKINALREYARKNRRTKEFDEYVRVLMRNNKKPLVVPSNKLLLKCSPDEVLEYKDEIRTGAWFVDENGIYKVGRENLRQYACRYPVLPVKRLVDVEDNSECMTLAFMRDYKWQYVTQPREMLANSRNVVALSRIGCPVDSEQARYFVSYISEYEKTNMIWIDRKRSTKRLGWVDQETFLPYDDGVHFNGDAFKPLYESIHSNGSRDVWYDEIRRIRSEGNSEIKIMIAAAFASVILSQVGGLSFIVDLWGLTEGGKTVTMKVCASVWADPEKETFIGNFQNTATALEVKSSVLNHLPLLLDDSNNVSKDLTKDGAIENLIYALCSGKGKSRSNKNLGIEPEKRWHNIIISNGEKPLRSYVKQGGAHNRVIELECTEEHFFPDPGRTMDVICQNYGFAGRDFIEMLKEDEDLITRIKRRRDVLKKEIKATDKQRMPAALLVAVDEVLTEKLFCDKNGFTVQDINKHLVNMTDISEGARCYDLLRDAIAGYPDKFSKDGTEIWGFVEKCNGSEVVHIIATRLDEYICRKNNFSKRQFIKWLDMRGLIKKDRNGKTSILERINGTPTRCCIIQLKDDPDSKEEWEPAGEQLEMFE